MTFSSSGILSGRRCVLVLGMHRSGTSALARVINLIGADLPRHLMPASGSNEAGHWEPALIVDISDRLLLESGSAWNDWRPFDPVSFVSPKRLNAYRAEIRRAIEQEFAGSSLFVLKDLRVSRFPAFFLDVLEAIGVEARVVIALRHPMSVAGSLKARDKMPINDALLLWLRYNVEVEQATRHLDRVVISYEDLMREPGDQIDRLKALIAPEATEDLEAARESLRMDLRHHFGHEIETPTFPELGRWASDAYAALQTLARDPDDSASQAMIDLVRTRIDADSRLHGDRISFFLETARAAQLETLDLMRQRDVGIELHRKLDHKFSQYRREVIGRLASSRRADFVIPDDVPKSLSPWRLLRPSKRQRVRRRLQDYLTILASPLFDADFYLRTYSDVATQDLLPALHYLLHGSNERRKPSAAVDPDDIDYLFPELAGREGNLVLNLIDLHLGGQAG